MGDFVQQSITKTAVRELTTPIEYITTFNTLVSGIISGTRGAAPPTMSEALPRTPVSKSREGYTARIEFEDMEAKIVSYTTARAPTVTAFNSAVTALQLPVKCIETLLFRIYLSSI